jgi:putative ABC transport system permease protein
MGGRLRRAVTIAQVAIAVMLVVVGGLYVRTYERLLVQPKGFDSANLASLSVALPNRFYPSYADRVALSDTLVARLRTLPFVVDAVAGSAPPSIGDTPSGGVTVGVDGHPGDGGPDRVAVTPIDPRYFSVLRVPLKSGRWLSRDDDEADTVIPESFARRFWPAGDAVGHTFQVFQRNGRKLWNRPDYRIVGVFQDYRTADRETAAPTLLQAFTARRPPKPQPPGTPRSTIDDGGSFGIADIVVRLDPASSAESVLAAVRPIDPRLVMTLDFVDGLYVDRHRATLFVARLVGVFAIGALLIALIGVYGVMSFLVATRTKEIGIRMALGADGRRIGRFVMQASLALVLTGAAIGLAGALALSRVIASQLFNVSPTDPATYVSVVGAVVGTALLATWRPMRRASRINPAETLRSE